MVCRKRYTENRFPLDRNATPEMPTAVVISLAREGQGRSRIRVRQTADNGLTSSHFPLMAIAGKATAAGIGAEASLRDAAGLYVGVNSVGSLTRLLLCTSEGLPMLRPLLDSHPAPSSMVGIVALSWGPAEVSSTRGPLLYRRLKRFSAAFQPAGPSGQLFRSLSHFYSCLVRTLAVVASGSFWRTTTASFPTR
jgi:hypothetical protein